MNAYIPWYLEMHRIEHPIVFIEPICCNCRVFSVQALYRDTMASLQELLKSVLVTEPSPDSIQSVFKVGPLFECRPDMYFDCVKKKKEVNSLLRGLTFRSGFYRSSIVF